MADEPTTTGTPGTGGDGGNATATGTPPASADGGNAEGSAELAAENERLRRLHAQSLAEKETLERTKQENEALRAQLAGRSYAPPTAYDPAAQRAQEIAATVRNVSERDPEVLALILESDRLAQERAARLEAENRWYRELGAIPPQDRQEVEQLARGSNRYPNDAYNDIRARRWEKEKETIAEQKRKLQEDADRMNRKVINTTTAPAPPAPPQDTITEDDYDKIIARLEKGQGSPEDRKRLNDVGAGKVRVRYG